MGEDSLPRIRMLESLRDALVGKTYIDTHSGSEEFYHSYLIVGVRRSSEGRICLDVNYEDGERKSILLDNTFNDRELQTHAQTQPKCTPVGQKTLRALANTCLKPASDIEGDHDF